MYEELQRRVNLADEAGNDLHEVDFIGKALEGDASGPASDTLEAAAGQPIRELQALSFAHIIAKRGSARSSTLRHGIENCGRQVSACAYQSGTGLPSQCYNG